MEENKNRKDESGNENKGSGWYSCIIWGMLAGIVFGAAIKNVGVGLSIGALFGYTYWIIFGSGKKNK